MSESFESGHRLVTSSLWCAMMPPMRKAWAATLAALAVVMLTGCDSVGVEPTAARDCRPDSLPTVYKGILTFSTDQPAYPPWFIGDDPANGEGFESAIAYAVAATLGYDAEQVRWVRIPFNAAMAPGPKPFDAGLSQYSITEQRREVVDFSSPYYNVTQAVVTLESSPAARATTLAGLRHLKLGAQVGTTSSTAARAVGGDVPIVVYNSNIDAKMALSEGQIDALVLDLPTAYTVQAELAHAVVVGQLPADPKPVEQFGVMLDKDSRLTACVSGAVDTLRGEGVLGQLEQRWLSEGKQPPVLTPN